MGCGSAGGREAGEEQLAQAIRQNTLECHYGREKNTQRLLGASLTVGVASPVAIGLPPPSLGQCVVSDSGGMRLLHQGRGWQEHSHSGGEAAWRPGSSEVGAELGTPQLHTFRPLAQRVWSVQKIKWGGQILPFLLSASLAGSSSPYS